MLKIDTILLPTDFSEQAKAASHLACSVARDHGAKIVVFHARPHPVISTEAGVVVDFDESLDPVIEKLRETCPAAEGLKFEYRAAEGDASTEILRAASEVGADLIVMGTHGRSGVMRVLMGSVAEEVLRGAACPVLTVKSEFPEGETQGGAAK